MKPWEARHQKHSFGCPCNNKTFGDDAASPDISSDDSTDDGGNPDFSAISAGMKAAAQAKDDCKLNIIEQALIYGLISAGSIAAGTPWLAAAGPVAVQALSGMLACPAGRAKLAAGLSQCITAQKATELDCVMGIVSGTFAKALIASGDYDATTGTYKSYLTTVLGIPVQSTCQQLITSRSSLLVLNVQKNGIDDPKATQRRIDYATAIVNYMAAGASTRQAVAMMYYYYESPGLAVNPSNITNFIPQKTTTDNPTPTQTLKPASPGAGIQPGQIIAEVTADNLVSNTSGLSTMVQIIDQCVKGTVFEAAGIPNPNAIVGSSSSSLSDFLESSTFGYALIALGGVTLTYALLKKKRST